MSDLIISINSVDAPPAACSEEPPTPRAGTRTAEDRCSIILPVGDSADPTAMPRLIRFDRAGDSFVLSTANAGETRAWFEGHANATTLLNSLRLTGLLMRIPGGGISQDAMRTLLMLSEYIVSGEVRVSSEEPEALTEGEVASALLDIFADSSESALAPILGRLQVVRRSTWLTAESMDRIRWVTSILDLVPQYRIFRGFFINEADIEGWAALPADRRSALITLTGFLRDIVVERSAGRTLHYSENFMEAYDAYRALYPDEVDSGARSDFCTALSNAMENLDGRSGSSLTFLQECRTALELRELTPEEALLRSLRNHLLGETGLSEFSALITEESAAANMTVEWLAERSSNGGRFREILDVFLENIEVTLAEVGSETDPILRIDISGLRAGLATLLDAHTTTRREYLLAALAIFRRFFGDSGEIPEIRAFSRDRFTTLHWEFGEAGLAGARAVLAFINEERESSQDQSDIFLPIIEAGVCAIGATGLVLSELLPEIHDSSDLRLGIGTASAGLTGLGCSSFIGHFIWPAIGEVRNHYLWDGITGAVGTVLGIGAYLLAFLLGGGNPPPTMPGIDFRFPIDEYGF